MRRRPPITVVTTVIALVASLAGISTVQAHADSSRMADAGSAETSTEASEIAAVHDHQVEVIGERSETTTVFANPDGTFTATLRQTPIRVQEPDGTYTPLDLNLVQQSDGSLAPSNALVDVKFSGGGDTDAVELPMESGRQLGLDWTTQLPEPTVSGSTATYRLAETRDLVLTATREGFKAHIMLKAPPASDTDFTFPLDLTRLRAAQTAGGRFKVEDNNGRTVAEAAPFRMWDSQTDAAGDPVNVHDVDSTFAVGEGDGALVLDPSMTWLTAPTTRYPVTIDPEVTLGQDGDTFVAEGTTTAQWDQYRLTVGTSPSACCEQISYLNWDTSALANKYITNATLKMFQYWAPSCTAKQLNHHPLNDIDNDPTNDRFPVQSMKWSNKPGMNLSVGGGASGFNRGASGCSDSNTGTNVNQDVTTTVKAWASGAAGNFGLGLNVPSASRYDPAFEKRFCSMNSVSFPTNSTCNNTSVEPQLVVSYALAPSAPASVQATVAYSGESATVQWAPATSSGTSLTGYQVQTQPGNVVTSFGAGATSGSISGLDPDTSYQFRVRGVNAAGTGAYSTYTTGSPVALDVEPDDGQIDVMWEEPTTVPSSGYTVTATPAAGNPTILTVPATETEASILGLNNGTAYTVAVRSNGGSFVGQMQSEPVVPSTFPGQPTNVSWTPITNGQSTVSWTPPTDTGGTPIVGYLVESTDQSVMKEVAANVTSVAVGDLESGRPYTFSVRAINESDMSPPTAVDPDLQAFEARQNHLTAFADALTAIDAETPPEDLANYAGVHIDGEVGVIDLYWKGSIPSSALSRAGALPAGLLARPQAADFSKAELEGAIDENLVDEESGKYVPVPGLDDEVVIFRAAASADGSGIQVRYGNVDLLSETPSSEPIPTDVTPTQVETALESLLNGEIPVSAESLDVAPESAAGRQNDGGQWDGGAGITNAAGSCSTGFGVRISGGGHGLITANHCTYQATSNVWKTYDGGVEVGTVVAHAPNRDAALIKTTNKKRKYAARRIFWGPWNTNGHHRIYGTRGMYWGQRLMTSGARSGTHFNLVVDSLHGSDHTIVRDDGTEFTLTYGWSAYQTHHFGDIDTGDKIASAKGDSGGPVVERDSVTHKMYAVGTIVGGYGKTPCKNVRGVDSEAKCHSNVVISPIKRTENVLDVKVRHYPD